MGTTNFGKGFSSGDQIKEELFRGGKNFRGKDRYSIGRVRNHSTRRGNDEIFNNQLQYL